MAATFDVVIIGSGPGGYVAAVRAGQLGLRTAVVEKDDRFGGTCLLRGCIPTKCMLESASIIDQARHAAEFGVTVGEVAVNMSGVLKRLDKVVQQNAGGVAFLLKKNKVQTFRGFGRLAGPGKVAVSGPEGEQIIETRHAILATGSDPRVLPGFEIDGKVVMTSDELLKLDVVPEHLIVLGAGAVGVEFASVFRSFGSEVTVVELLDRLVPLEDEEVSKEFERIFKKRGIKTHTATKLVGLERTETGVRARLEPTNGAPTMISGSHFLLAVGRKPMTANIGLEGTKVEVDRGFVKADAFYRTAEPGVYAIGDIVAGTPQLAHAASAEGIIAVEHIAGLNPPTIDYRQVPGCTYSNPEIGSLGYSEAQAKAKGYELKVGKFPFSALGKAKVLGDSNGFVKIVADARYGEILGVHIIGPHATDLIAEAGPLLKLECTVEELARTIHAHPTLSEAIGEAAHATLGHALHL
ncbi:MAG: dihydrolipoyl dehydrogenase [Myxococcales bacterium]|nr:dihydrolipoyl dehydrogenase [Myxococcales bacterium]